jgi:hypothetical protein
VLGTDGAGADIGWLPAHQKTFQARLPNTRSAHHKGNEILEQDVTLLQGIIKDFLSCTS